MESQDCNVFAVWNEYKTSLLKFISNLKNENHPNLLNIDGDVVFLEEINTVAFRTDSPDHISTWK